MRNIVLLALIVVGVISDTTEVTSRASQLIPASTKYVNQSKPSTNEKISTSLKTKMEVKPANRREGVSYSSSVIHRDSSHPEQEAASSIDFRLNTDTKPSYDDQSPLFGYTTPTYKFNPHAGEYINPTQSDDATHISQGHFDVIYGQNTAPIHPKFQHEQNNLHTIAVEQVPVQNHDLPVQNTHVNHQSYYKPVFVQSTYPETKHKMEVMHTPTQYKHVSHGGRMFSTSKPKTTPRGFKQSPTKHSYGSHGSHSHQSNHKLPIPQAYTQAIYHKSEEAKLGKAISFSLQNQNQNQHDNSRQTQSFNVGYSVKFGNDQGSQGNQKRKPYKPIRPDSDIITGLHKEEVSKPAHLSSLSHHIFPTTETQDDQKYFSASSNSPQQILSQANLTPKTQKQLAFLENIQNHKFMHKEPVQNNVHWKNLSPSVEIYRSKEISIPSGSTTITSTNEFDHEKAIGKSEGFDYTNAVNYGNEHIVQISDQKQNNEFLSIPGLNPHGHETQQVLVHAQLDLQPQNSQSNDQISFLRLTDSGDEISNSENIPTIPKLPIDTSLIREPFLTVHKDQMQPHSAQLPIHFDTSLIKGTNHAYGEILSAEGHGLTSGSTYHNKFSQINNLLAEQSQQHNSYQHLAPNSIPPQIDTISHKSREHHNANKPIILLQGALGGQVGKVSSENPVNQDDMTFSFPQNGLFNPIMAMISKPITTAQIPVLFTPQANIKTNDAQLFKHLKMYKVKENVPDYAQPQQHKFKVFGKPGNAFMRHQYEKMRHEGLPVRPQEVHFQPGPNKRLVREYTNIEMDLRPPPQTMQFKTANFLRIKQ